MAGDWIKMRTNLHDHPKVIAIAAALDLPELHVIGCLWRVWSWADSHTLDGNAICVTDVTLDRMTAVTGFADALRKVGWLEGRDSALTFPRFAEHNGQTAKNRLETASRVRKHRNAKSVTSVTENCYQEKRREEKITKETHTTRARSQIEPPSRLQDAVAAFLLCWNKAPGVRQCPDQFSVASPALLVERFGDPAWVSAWPKAIAKFPLKAFSEPVSVTQFLGADFVRNVLNGHYDFDPKKLRSGSARDDGPRSVNSRSMNLD